KKHLDTVIVVPNQNLFKIASETTTFEESFNLSNNVLMHGVQSVTDLMVRPGMINLDFADVETVMSSMGKAMMGTGEAEGENRAMAATEMALNNPLIDEYSLQGAKGLLVNITGGSDIKLFEVDQAVNKIRAEVDPDAELIFGAIKDENMNGKMRVSIVATALDGHKPESKTVLNMVSRIQNRNPGYSDGMFAKSTHIENNTLNSISGSNALKLDEEFKVDTSEEIKTTIENDTLHEAEQNIDQINSEVLADGVSMESASYIEKNEDITSEVMNDSEYTPQLFSDETDLDGTNDENINNDTNIDQNQNQKLFDQEVSDEEDFEIPAFLRRQKF
ncbi:MAG: cell division protein FtsZ, partial [Candidatus Pelagibacter sp. TMED165]